MELRWCEWLALLVLTFSLSGLFPPGLKQVEQHTSPRQWQRWCLWGTFTPGCWCKTSTLNTHIMLLPLSAQLRLSLCSWYPSTDCLSTAQPVSLQLALLAPVSSSGKHHLCGMADSVTEQAHSVAGHLLAAAHGCFFVEMLPSSFLVFFFSLALSKDRVCCF